MSAVRLSSVLHLAQAALSGYTLYPTYLSITRTQTYEATTEKVAKYISTAEWHLWKTRKTLGLGTVGVISSLLTSTYLALNSHSDAKTTSNPLRAIASFVLAATLTASHTHISNYWRGKAKVPTPGMSDYNDAISSTALMRRYIGVLALIWGLLAIIYTGQALF